MSGQNALRTAPIEQLLSVDLVQTIALQLGEIAIEFPDVKRKPRYPDGRRENDLEHSYMLGLIATEIANYLNLDVGLVTQYSMVHDLLELITGDTATFQATDEDLSIKTQAEEEAKTKIKQRLPTHTVRLLDDYESQKDMESRFVRLVDKLMPVIVDILGCGSQVMKEDYDIYSKEQLSKAHEKLDVRYTEMFPESEFTSLHIARNGLAKKFVEIFEPSEMQYTLF